MIRRRLLAILAGVFVFAIVIGSAALLNVNSNDLQAGIDVNLVCDADGVTVSYQTAHSTGGFIVESVIVDGIDPACAGATLTVDLHDGLNASIATTTPWVVAGTTSPALTLGPVLAQDVTGVAVLING